jgi:plastocyanin
MKSYWSFLLIAVAAISVLVSACSSSPPPPEPVSFTIEMSEYAFSPDTIEVKVGQEVTFELINIGLIEHELMIGRNVMMDHNRPSGYMVDLFESANVEPMVMGGSVPHEDAHGDIHQGFMIFLEKTGDQASMTFTVTEEMVGEWEIGCFLLEGVHYDSGMVGKFIVSP